MLTGIDMDKVRKLFSLSDHYHASVGIYQPSLVQWGNSCKVEISLINLLSLQKLLERSYTTEANRYAIYPSLHGGRMWHKIGLMWGSYYGVKDKKMPSHSHLSQWRRYPPTLLFYARRDALPNGSNSWYWWKRSPWSQPITHREDKVL